jgi:asparagine synthase (glutamine-hydrolysing)
LPQPDWFFMAIPFIHLTIRDGRVSMAGNARFNAGHRIPKPGSPVDDGVFASWEWRNDTLTVTNDRYGFSPLFYATSGHDLMVSPSIEGLLRRGASPTLNAAAIAVFLRLNYFIGEDTPFEHIRTVPPAARFMWRAGRLEVEDRRPRTPARSTLSRTAAIDEFLARFATAISRRLPGRDRAVLPLSGGRDSRHILLALERAGAAPARCVTVHHYPPRTNRDAEIASRLAERVSAEHVVLDTPSSRIRSEHRKNRLTHFCSDEHVQFLPLRDYFRRHPATIYDGIAGDTLTQSWRVPPEMVAAFARGNVSEASTQLFEYEAPGLERGIQALLTREAANRFSYELAYRRLCAETARHLGGPNPPLSFIFWNRTRREVALAPYGLLGFLPQVFAPFLDADVYDFLASLPIQLVVDRRFQEDALRVGYPKFADIPFESPDERREDSRFARRLAGELLRYARRPSRMFRRRYVVPRAAVAWTRGRAAPLWFVSLTVWLRQIEIAAAGRLIDDVDGTNQNASEPELGTFSEAFEDEAF